MKDIGKIDQYQPQRTTKSTNHYSDIIMGAMASQITSLTIAFFQAQIKENIKKLRVTGLCAGN